MSNSIFSKIEKILETRDKRLQKIVDLITEELMISQRERREIRQMVNQLEANDHRQEVAIDNLDQRVLKLETAK